jgi:hypothetical protein
MVAKKRGRKPGIKVGPYKRDFEINEYLSSATLRAMTKDVAIAIQKLNIKLKSINRHLEAMKGK